MPVTHPPSGRLLTLGIPVFNGRSLLRKCLESVIDSTFPRDRFEIIVADDGSTHPETLAILAEFERTLAAEPGFFRVITLARNSGGAARPRNRILDEATGDYVFFIDSDDTIGSLALERIAEAVATAPADWIALHQVAVNGRATVCSISRQRTEVPRAKALSTLTVHKCFRRAEIERQRLRFDEGLPSGQDVAFAFSYIVNASRFVMLGGYDYYYLTQHAGDPDEPSHLSKRAKTAEAIIAKNERILRLMLAALRSSSLGDSERRAIVAKVTLPRVLLRHRYLNAIATADPRAARRACRRLSRLLGDPLITDLEPEALKPITHHHLRAIAEADLPRLRQLLSLPAPAPRPALRTRWSSRCRRLVDKALGRTRHRQIVRELDLVRRGVDELRDEQRRLETVLTTQPRLRDPLTERPSGLSPIVKEAARHACANRPDVVVEWGSGISTVWIGRALVRVGAGRLVSFEDSVDVADLVTEMLQQEALNNTEIRRTMITATDSDQPADAISGLADVDRIDLVVVNPPRRRLAELPRYAALPVLRDRLSPGATILVSTGHRDEEESVHRWLTEFPELTLLREEDDLAELTIR